MDASDRSERPEESVEEVADDYRRWIIQAEHTATRDFDRAVMTLGGGALILSVTFLTDIVSEPSWVGALVIAWTLFTLSILAIFGSFLASMGALRKTLEQIDAGTLYDGHPGGAWDTATHALNIAAAITLILGLIALILFAAQNV